MDKIRVSKVEDVTLWRQGQRVEGTLHLTTHHIIYQYLPPPSDGQPIDPNHKPRPKELWIAYPLISFCTYRPSHPASRQAPSIRLRCRDFTFVAFHFVMESRAREVYDTVRSLTCKLGRIERLYAFSYKPPAVEKALDGWHIYDPRAEWKRMGISPKDTDKGWRISEINKDYSYSPTYPALLVVPSTISDNVLNYAGKYRSRARIPVLTYLHPVNNCSITRSSQPQAGFRGNRSVQDEKLVAAIFATSANKPPMTSGVTTPTVTESSPEGSITNADSVTGEGESSYSQVTIPDPESFTTTPLESGVGATKIYGAQQRNLIVDARPTLNAYAMQAVGLGSENMDYYRGATKAYLGIDNIHVMRNSLNKVVEALKDSDVTPLGPNKEQLAKSGWLFHISNLLDGSALIARQVGIQHSHVLIHCSDGWDRTSQLSALSQICLDPYYRTLEGFIVLVEKDWLSFGHMFRHRSGFLNSEKWFEIENERIGAPRGTTNGAGQRLSGGGGNAFENALLSAKGLFNKKNDSRESLVESDGDIPFDSAQGAGLANHAHRTTVEEKTETKIKEISPVFHQFLDATYQLLYQYPTRFEFNERFLRRLLYHLYSCQYGTFLYDNEKQRVEANAYERTRSVWDYFLARKEQFLNKDYDPTVDDNVKGKERLIFPKKGQVRWWAEAFGRRDEEMNSVAPGESFSHLNNTDAPVVAATETAEQEVDTDAANPPQSVPHPAQEATGLATPFASLTVGRGSTPSPHRSKSPRQAREEVGMEMSAGPL